MPELATLIRASDTEVARATARSLSMGMMAGASTVTAMYAAAARQGDKALAEAVLQETNRLQDWEKNAFTKRLRQRRGNCDGCGAPLTLDAEGGCEYCGRRP